MGRDERGRVPVGDARAETRVRPAQDSFRTGPARRAREPASPAEAAALEGSARSSPTTTPPCRGAVVGRRAEPFVHLAQECLRSGLATAPVRGYSAGGAPPPSTWACRVASISSRSLADRLVSQSSMETADDRHLVVPLADERDSRGAVGRGEGEVEHRPPARLSTVRPGRRKRAGIAGRGARSRRNDAESGTRIRDVAPTRPRSTCAATTPSTKGQPARDAGRGMGPFAEDHTGDVRSPRSPLRKETPWPRRRHRALRR